MNSSDRSQCYAARQVLPRVQLLTKELNCSHFEAITYLWLQPNHKLETSPMSLSSELVRRGRRQRNGSWKQGCGWWCSSKEIGQIIRGRGLITRTSNSLPAIIGPVIRTAVRL